MRIPTSTVCRTRARATQKDEKRKRNKKGQDFAASSVSIADYSRGGVGNRRAMYISYFLRAREASFLFFYVSVLFLRNIEFLAFL